MSFIRGLGGVGRKLRIETDIYNESNSFINWVLWCQLSRRGRTLGAACSYKCSLFSCWSRSCLCFYDAFKHGLKLGSRSPNDVPERLPLIHSNRAPSLTSSCSVRVFLESVGEPRSRLTAQLPFGHQGWQLEPICHLWIHSSAVYRRGWPVKSLSE